MAATPLKLSAAAARRTALAAQGFTDPRPSGRIDRRHLRRVFDRVGMIQIDTVNVLVRSQELPLFARLGHHPRTLLPDAAVAGELFEYWGHAASHIPTAHHHLFRWKMEAAHNGAAWGGLTALQRERPGFVEEILERVRAEGPIVAGDVSERVGPKGSWWDWDDGKRALEFLFWSGLITARRRDADFARIYDVPERMLPAEVLATPTPTETEARKQLLVLAARALGVGTLADLTDYYRLNTLKSRVLVKELVEEGRLVPAVVEGWSQVAYLHPDARMPRRIDARALLSPFDSTVWFRDRTLRLFGFHYRIEIYVPKPKRQFGYYVLPFLLGDELVARVDLKADRAAGVLLVQSAFGEPGIHEPEVAAELGEELVSMAAWLGLERVEVVGRGDLSRALAGSPALV